MKRIHLFEWMDLPWFPDFLRNYMTDFLQFLSNKADMYKSIVPLLSETIRQTDSRQLVDLGSGGGGGLIKLAENLQEQHPALTIVLTDLYPNITAFEATQRQSNRFTYYTQPVDAMNVPGELTGLRTQFLSLHHFRPEQAVRILQNAVDSGSPIAIFEAQERSVKSLFFMLLSPLSVLLTTPLIRPFRVGRLVFTYLIPIIPLAVMWDGLVSCLRTYSVTEMQALVKQVNGHASYDWNIGKVASGPGNVLYLIGQKK